VGFFSSAESYPKLACKFRRPLSKAWLVMLTEEMEFCKRVFLSRCMLVTEVSDKS
jgi:hypothetical protein